MGFFESSAAGLGLGAASLIGNFYNTMQSSKYARENLRLQKESQEEAKFMNRNQFQVQSADALKAGINPLAMSGGNVQSASAQNVEAPQMDLSGVNQILGTFLQGKLAKEQQKSGQDFAASEAQKNREHEELLATMKLEAEKNRQSERLAQEDKHFNANLDEIKDYHSKMVEIENANIDVKKKQNMLQELRDNVAKSAQDILNNLREQQSELNEVELKTKCRELATLLVTDEKNIKSGNFNEMIKKLGLAISGSIKDSHDLTQAIYNSIKRKEY